MSTEQETTATNYTSGEQLLIIDPTGDRYQHPIRRKSIRIGHDLDNDIVLNGAGIASRHLQLEWKHSHWYILEMESGHPTRLGLDLLPPSSTNLFPINGMLEIGKYKIILQERSGQGNSAESNSYFPHPNEVAPRLIQSSDHKQADYFSVSIWPEQIQSGDTVVISILNEGKQTNHYSIQTGGDMRLRFSRDKWTAHSRPGMESRHQLTVFKKRFSNSKKIPFEIHVESETGYAHQETGFIVAKPSVSSKTIANFVAVALLIGFLGILYTSYF